MTPSTLLRALPSAIPFLALCSAAIAANPSAQPLPKCCVWRVTSTKAPFYLVGSVHALSPSDYPLPSAYEVALRDSSQLLFECDPKQSAEFAKQFAAAATFPKGQDLTQKINPKALAWMRANLRSINVHYNQSTKKYQIVKIGTIDEAKQYRAWYVADHLVGVPGFANVSHEKGVDYYLSQKARQAGKQVGGLESVGEHVAVMAGMSDIDAQIILLDALVYERQAGSEFNRVRAAWRRGDTDALWASRARQRKEAFWIEQRLVDRRNIKWIPRIEAQIKSGKPTAIVAGALHFSGPNSVVNLLRKRGYTVEQL